MAYLDLDELPRLGEVSRWFGVERWRPLSFFARDHELPEGPAAGESIRDLVAKALQWRPHGSVRLLTQLRTWGHYFSPLNLYYCFDAACGDNQPAAVVAEVSNTPWNERHRYVLDLREQRKNRKQADHDKSFHVSPFQDMRARYHWSITTPAAALNVRLACVRKPAATGQPLRFAANMQLSRQPLTAGSLRGLAWRHPGQTLGILAGIYFEAFRLWRKKAPFFPHPKRESPPTNSPPNVAAN